jgi:inorganic pyrophosphatase
MYPFEELPLRPLHAGTDDYLAYAIVEQARDSLERTVWDEARREFVKTGLIMAEPLPAPYGWLPQTRSLGDNDALDVLILTEANPAQGEFLVVRPVGVLLRRDLDHKVLAVAIEDARFGPVRDYAELPPPLLTAIEDWFRPYFELDGWLNATGARQMIERDHLHFKATVSE